MFALTKFAETRCSGHSRHRRALSLPVRADELVQNLGPVGPHDPILTTVGSKRVIAFYTPDGGHCGIHLTRVEPRRCRG